MARPVNRAAAHIMASPNDTRADGRHNWSASTICSFRIGKVAMLALRSSATSWSILSREREHAHRWDLVHAV